MPTWISQGKVHIRWGAARPGCRDDFQSFVRAATSVTYQSSAQMAAYGVPPALGVNPDMHEAVSTGVSPARSPRPVFVRTVSTPLVCENCVYPTCHVN